MGKLRTRDSLARVNLLREDSAEMLKDSQHDKHRDLVDIRESLARRIAAHAPSVGQTATPVDGLVLFRHDEPSACHWATCEPSLSVFAQGKKLINLGDSDYL